MDDWLVFYQVGALRADQARHFLSPASLDVHVRAADRLSHTTGSNYLADRDLDTLAPGDVTTMAAIELCLAGWWRRLDGGYLVVDQDLIDAMPHGAVWRGAVRQRIVAACRRTWKALNRETFIPL